MTVNNSQLIMYKQN